MAHPIHGTIGPLTAALHSQYPNQNLEHAFIQWYAEMRFGKKGSGMVKHYFVDGPGDMGIDYCVETKTGYVVIQSKFSQTLLDSSIPKAWCDEFAGVVDHLNDISDSDDFKTWIAKCTKQATKDLYTSIRSAAKNGKQVRFVFATTRKFDGVAPATFRIDARDEIAYCHRSHEIPQGAIV